MSIFSNEHCGCKGETRSCSGNSDCSCPCTQCERAVITALRTRLAEVEAERDAENALGNHLVAERDRVISEFDDALTTARGLLAEVETELARERDAHRLEKRAHEGTWNHKARVIDALTTARGLLGEVMSADDGYMLGKSLSARITAFLEGK